MPMQCPKCGFNNPDGAKFCQKCANVFSANVESNSEQILHQQNNLDENQGSKKIKTIILVIVCVLIISGLGFAGYYYKDKIFKQKTQTQIKPNDNQQEKAEQIEPAQEDEEELIFGNYQQLILVENDVQNDFPLMKLDKDETKPIVNIDNLEELNMGININTNNLNLTGGYQSGFKDDTNKIKSKILVFKTIDEAQNYILEVKKSIQQEVKKMETEFPGTPSEEFTSMIQDIQIGQDGFKFNFIIMDLIFFRVKNAINILQFTGLDQSFLEEDILNLVQKQFEKYQNYTPIAKNQETDFSIDSDNDGLKDYMEERHRTNKNNPDTDGDGYADGDEVKKCYDPLGPGRLISDMDMQHLTDRNYLESLRWYYPKKDEDVLKLNLELDHTKYKGYIELETVKTGIYVPEMERYYLLEDSLNKIYINSRKDKIIECRRLYEWSQSEEEKQICRNFNDESNFEIDCERIIE